ncbi:MAG: TauD/TfdA family dioxygenase [Rhodovarius sp.]|nr:TauD/TfdA family dioxygenase [Rhodovarius sp.]MCX7932388.1 TauD/TfdA family dioxygenase [Rhodovarius sp.]MDW8314125.1 TauD/TfdA family dioxygenase [Rhodovarius sp.]
MDSVAHPIGGPAAWRGRELERRGFWPRRFTDFEISLLEEALRRLSADPPAIRREDFAIPLLEPLWTTLSRELEQGAGVVRLSGFPVERHDLRAIKRLFWAICTQLGTPLPQNTTGEILAEVKDEQGAAMAEEGGVPTARARSRSSGPLRWHTDKCDLLALMCVSNGIAGGISRVVSTVAIHDEIARIRPDLLAVLYRDFWRRRPADEEGPRARPEDAVFPMPIFARGPDGSFTSQYSRTYVEMAQGTPGVPPLTAEQMAALDLLAEVADALCIEAPFTPGDIQILNQHVTYHGRTAYADDVARGARRVLLRIWLAPPNSRPLPPSHAAQWGNTAPGALRGGAMPGLSAYDI